MSEEEKTNDHTCPVMCGECCGYWQDVPELTSKFPDRPLWSDCPHLGDTGCDLPRNERPMECLDYLCTKAADELFPNETTQDIIKRAIDACK